MMATAVHGAPNAVKAGIRVRLGVELDEAETTEEGERKTRATRAAADTQNAVVEDAVTDLRNQLTASEAALATTRHPSIPSLRTFESS